ncbi:MAG: FAD-dependent monooxygenase [Alphaproteobacteria bacterium]|nr:FAD-dependent monooxygenase [Alphaproteobacteria bacterium]
MTNESNTRVLIAGAGPVGLSLAIELGLRGVDCMLVERGDGIPRVPKMSSVSARGMEFCRRWGIADKVRYAVWSKTHPLDFVYVSTMVGDELARLRIPSYAERQGKMDYSPEGAASCPQIFFDPILAEKVKSIPKVSPRYGTRLVAFEQDEGGVRAQLADERSGESHTIAADYLVGCDGAGGIVRRSLGIPLDGLGPIATSVNVFFRSAEFSGMHDKGWAHIYRFFDDDGCWAELIAVDGTELYRLSVFQDATPDLGGDSYLRRLAGRDFAYEILDVSPWERRDFLARSYRRGRVLIAGDAAHEMSPTAGAGMHTGICEAVNLAWKLAAVLEGWGGPRLLESYEAECRPVAAQNVALSTAMFDAIAALPGAAAFGEAAAADGDLPRRFTPPNQRKAQIRYEDSPICVADGTPPPEDPNELTPSARPGTRAPHCWLADGRSTLDLFGDGFVLVRFGAPDADVGPLRAAACARGVPLEVVDIDHGEAAAIYEKPLVLVRPDGHVAWRGDTLPDDAQALIDRVRGA